MKTIVRAICAVIFLASIAFAIAMCIFWARSYSMMDSAGFGRTTTTPARSMAGMLGTTGGRCVLEYQSALFSNTPNALTNSFTWSTGHTPNKGAVADPPGSHHWLGFGFSYENEPVTFFFGVGMQIKTLQIWAPLWSVILLSLTVAAVAFGKGRKQPKPGRCRRCGSDLRASPDLCPECGLGPPLKSYL